MPSLLATLSWSNLPVGTLEELRMSTQTVIATHTPAIETLYRLASLQRWCRISEMSVIQCIPQPAFQSAYVGPSCSQSSIGHCHGVGFGLTPRATVTGRGRTVSLGDDRRKDGGVPCRWCVSQL
ncbi:hypothetical protein BDW22DRAFT_142297 [Trametopsis cervina]|nr:hypothetical protein BDW22DRAFT_142297 [Trametopsis cervina]